MTLDDKAVKIHPDGIARCFWCGDGSDALYVSYHDTEWGVPEYDDRALFEKLILEGFQAGLSWITILRKRENFQQAFDGFDPSLIARYDAQKTDVLMQNAGIVRHRGKIEATIGNAKIWLDMMENGPGFSNYLWSYVEGAPKVNEIYTIGDLPAVGDAAKALSKDLKKRGFKFCGPTIVYAFMQAVGMVNDHAVGCHCRG